MIADPKVSYRVPQCWYLAFDCSHRTESKLQRGRIASFRSFSFEGEVVIVASICCFTPQWSHIPRQRVYYLDAVFWGANGGERHEAKLGGYVVHFCFYIINREDPIHEVSEWFQIPWRYLG